MQDAVIRNLGIEVANLKIQQAYDAATIDALKKEVQELKEQLNETESARAVSE